MTPAEAVVRCEQLMSHAWMVRTFVKHSSEVEDFPELNVEKIRAALAFAAARETHVKRMAA